MPPRRLQPNHRQKWFAPTPAIPVRVTRFIRSRSNRRRYVCVEISKPAGSFVIFFFRHDDGTWRVFPPEVERPTMDVSSAGGTIWATVATSNAG